MIVKIILSAVLLYFSFPNYWDPHGLWPLAWIALVPFLAGIDGKLLRTRFWGCVCYGIVLYGLLLQWLWPVHFVGTLLFVLAMAVQPILFAVFYKSVTRHSLDFFYVPALWVASEWARTIILHGFYWGLSYSQTFEPAMIQLASSTGPYGVSFVIVLVNYLLFRSFKIPSQRKALITVSFIIFLLIYGVGTWSLSTSSKEDPAVSVCAVQPNIPSSQKLSLKDFDDTIEAQVALTKKAVAARATDMIIWPETAFPADVFKDKIWYPRLQRIAVENQAVFVFGAVPVIEGNSFNSAIGFDRQGRLTGVHHKQFLVPISEQTLQGKVFDFLKNMFDGRGFNFTPGNKADVFTITGDVSQSLRFGTMICSETCYPSIARELALKGAGFVVVMLNDGWFTQPAAIMMHAQNAIMRAVESGMDIVSVGNTGLTCRVNAQGVMRKDQNLPVQSEAYGIFHVTSHSRPTLYSRIGDLFAEACSLFVIIFFIRLRLFKVEKANKPPAP